MLFQALLKQRRGTCSFYPACGETQCITLVVRFQCHETGLRGVQCCGPVLLDVLGAPCRRYDD